VKPSAAKLVRGTLLLAVLTAFVLFARTIEWKETWLAVRSASPALLVAATLVNLLSLTLKAVRWWIFLRPIGVPSLWLAIRATFAGAALNNILIANTGEAARVIFVGRATRVPTASVLATLALERLFELVGYVLLLALAVSVLALPPALDQTRPFAMAALALAIAVLVYLVRHPEKAEMPVLEGEGLLHRARHHGRRFLWTLTGISTGPRFMVSLIVSVVSWGLQVATYMLTARAAHFEISAVGTIAAILAVNLGFAIRVTPGNVGVFQMIYAMTAVAFGLDKNHAIGVALLIQAQQILPVTMLGLLAAPKLVLERPRELPGDSNTLPGEPARGERLHDA
jgi:uncharacterized protein (TIRG00374 family)